MASLRELLLAETFVEYGGVTQVDRTVEGQQLYFAGQCNNTQDTNFCRNILCCWQVPAGVTSLTFEIWGGGGGGAGACCCGWGHPGGAGAYAKKAVTGSLGGENYQLFAAYAGCCSPSRSCGYRGCQSWVTGTGLSNFCAEGGLPGCFNCNAWICHEQSSGCGRYSWFLHCGSRNECACYYGADYGVPGRTGYIYTDECSANSCQYKPVVPIPAEFTVSGCTFHAVRYEGFNDVGTGPSYRVGAQMGITGGNVIKAFGSGGVTASAQSGNCYCGTSGGPGLVKVSYK